MLIQGMTLREVSMKLLAPFETSKDRTETETVTTTCRLA